MCGRKCNVWRIVHNVCGFGGPTTNKSIYLVENMLSMLFLI